MKKNIPIFIRAFVETPNFTFEAFASTEIEAFRQLKAAWARHRKQTGATMSFSELAEDISYDEITLGSTLRDREVI